MAFKILLALALLVVVSADRPQYQQQYAAAPEAPAQYNFDWAVEDAESGNNYGHTESRDGDNTQGSYYVLLPDGRTQRVVYQVNGDSGYVAEVSYEGEARYDQPQQAAAPAYNNRYN